MSLLLLEADIPRAGLVAAYDFVQRANGQVLRDTWGGLHGQLGSTAGVDTNDPTWIPQGLNFDGVDDFVRVSNDIPFRFTGPFSFSLALRFTTTDNLVVAEVNRNPGFSIQTSSATVGGGPGQLIMVMGIAVMARTGITLNDGQWRYVQFMIPAVGSSAYLILVNGQPQTVAVAARPTPTYGTFPFEIGSRAGALGFGGPIAYITARNHMMSHAEALQEYRAVRAMLARRGIALP